MISNNNERDWALVTLEERVRLEELDKILKNDPSNIELLLEKAFIYHYGELQEEAIGIYKEILKIEPENLTAHIWICESVYCLGDPYLLKEFSENALKLYPNRAEFYKFLVESLDILHYFDFEKVQDLVFLHLRKAIELEPDWISTRIALIEYLIKIRNFKLAIHEVQEAFKYIKDDFPIPTDREEYQYEYLVTRRVGAESNKKDLNDLLDDINSKIDDKNK